MIRVDYERMKDKPGFCRIVMWDQGEGHISDRYPNKVTVQEDVPEAEVVKRVTELSARYNQPFKK